MAKKGLNAVSTPGMTGVQEGFLKHLQESERIIFSAPFGLGKTYFIQEFFELPQLKEQCEVFTIHPVNYCTADNKDIFELIKFDLVDQLVEKEYIRDEFEKGYDPDEHDKRVVNFFAEMGNAVTLGTFKSSIDSIKKACKIYKEIKNSDEELEKTDDNDALKFRDDLKGEDGLYFEMGTIAKIIQKKISEINSTKYTILVIEDLDRLDPAHMFRLLNIFSAHDDPKTFKNKFGFSKVMFVCDLDNVKKIYRHFYGPDTDFEGYMNKFYDTEPYEFGNFEAISNYVDKVLFDCFPTDTGNRNLLHLILWEAMKALADVNRVKFRNIIKIKPEKLESIVRTKKNWYCQYIISDNIPYYIVDITKRMFYLLPAALSILHYLVPESKTDEKFFKHTKYGINIPEGYMAALKLERKIFGISRDGLFNLCSTDSVKGDNYFIDKKKIDNRAFDLMEALDEIKEKMQ